MGEVAAPLDTWPDELIRLTRWAWRAAGAQVLAAGRRLSTGSLPRLVLVPVGMLALVPWHAAVRAVDGGQRYLVQDVVLSYAASARLLCDVVDRAPVSAGAALIVGNPTNDLRAAGLEAQAVREAFYPDADYLGMVGGGMRAADWSTAPDGAGSPAQVFDRIADRSRSCPVLHLACHASADATSPSGSYLQLSAASLHVGALMERAPTGPLAVGTVVLAACSTNVGGGHYDEAFSISTAFLAAGARTAIGSLWTVPDGFTSRLMFMLHHYLCVEVLPAVDALRQAQLRMLVRHRDPPSTMPEALLTAPVESRAYEHPMNWAGFTHLGR